MGKLLAAIVLLIAQNNAPVPPASPLPVIVVGAPNADLRLEVARTEGQREYGLMNRTSIAPRTGMIFVFSQDGSQSFWMKDTLVPLDMIFVAADGTVRKVFANVPVLPPGVSDDRIPLETANAKYVIELGAGDAQREGIVRGVKLKLGDVPPAT